MSYLRSTPARFVTTALIVFAFNSLTHADNRSIPASPRQKKIEEALISGNLFYDCDAAGSKRCSIDDFMTANRVCALVAIKADLLKYSYFDKQNGFCVDENRPASNDWSKPYGIASVTKALTSTLVGHAIATQFGATTKSEFERILKRPVESFVPQLAAAAPQSGYAGVPLADVLNMRSGVNWNEYGWFGWFSDNARFERRVRHGDQPQLEFANRYRNHRTGAQRPAFNYSALDAAVAAVVAESMLGGEKLTAFLARGLWSALGTEAPARMGIDSAGTGIGPCCFSASVRDMARFGMLVRDMGRNIDGERILPAAWFDIATPRERRMSGVQGLEALRCGEPLEYSYFWWRLPGRPDFTAIGRSGQYIHIYPQNDVVIVQIADWGAWEDGDARQCESFKVHDALVESIR